MRSVSTARTDQPTVRPPGRIAMVGVGGFGRFCLDAYRKTPDIAVVAAADPNLAGTAPAGYPDLRIESDWATILDDPSIEVMHIATPPFLRGEIALPALRAGKSVFCEKPLALSLDEADRMITLSRETGHAIGTNYVLRHHSAFTLLNLLASSTLFGPLRTLSLQNFAQALRPDHWMWDERKSGGILVEHGVHFFDAYAQLTGVPESVWGTAPREEAVQVTVQYASAALGSFYHEFAFPQPIERTHAIAFFQKGHVEIDGWIPERVSGKVIAPLSALQDAMRPLQLPFNAWEEAGVARFEVQFPDRNRAYQSAIVDGVRDLITAHRDPKHVLTVSAEDSRRSLALALAARRATETGAKIPLSN